MSQVIKNAYKSIRKKQKAIDNEQTGISQIMKQWLENMYSQLLY